MRISDWSSDVCSSDLRGPGGAFERYYSETFADKNSADLIVVGAPDAWQRFVGKKALAEYASPESAKLPEWSRPFPGLYTLATDPMVIIYNKVLLKPGEYPRSLAQLAQMTSADPERWRNKVTPYVAYIHSFAYHIHWSVAAHGKPGGWDILEQLGSVTRPENGG